jgi:hypothetical protein
VVGNDFYTIAVSARIDNILGNQPGAAGTGWLRLVDFKHGSLDSGLYDYRGQLNLYPDACGTESPAPLVDGVYEMVVLTRDSTGLVTGYVNGVQQFSFSDSSNDAVIDSHNTLRFFRDNTGTAPNEASSGAVARIELFNTALSASDVAALTAAGAPTLFIAPRSGAPGAALSVSRGGFTAGEQVNVTYKTGLASPSPASCDLFIDRVPGRDIQLLGLHPLDRPRGDRDPSHCGQRRHVSPSRLYELHPFVDNGATGA